MEIVNQSDVDKQSQNGEQYNNLMMFHNEFSQTRMCDEHHQVEYEKAEAMRTTTTLVATLPLARMFLKDRDLWQLFDKHTTEMIITRKGRRMFPFVNVEIEGLHPNAMYAVYIDFVLVDDRQWKFNRHFWIPNGTVKAYRGSNISVHPDSPKSGHYWMTKSIKFHRLKLSNSDNVDNTMLTSMQKYQPRIHIVQVEDDGQPIPITHQSYCFQETKFIAVTAYQNTDITQLKIDHNPFARAFRDHVQDSKSSKKKVADDRAIASTSGRNNVPSSFDQHLAIGLANAVELNAARERHTMADCDANFRQFTTTESDSIPLERSGTIDQSPASNLNDDALPFIQPTNWFRYDSVSGGSSKQSIDDPATTPIVRTDFDFSNNCSGCPQTYLMDAATNQMGNVFR